MGTVRFQCQLSDAKGHYSAFGAIDDGRVTVSFREFMPSRGQREAADKQSLTRGTTCGGSVGKVLFEASLRLTGAASSHAIGELLRKPLATHLHCPVNKVRVTGVSFEPRKVSEGGAGNLTVYNYICHAKSEGWELTAYGQVTDEVTFLLCKGRHHPTSGGGLIGADLLVDTLPLADSVDKSSYRTLEGAVMELVQKRVAAYLHRSPQKVTVSAMRIGPDRTETDRRLSEEKEARRSKRR
ncbi:MAG TPA: hypothetical protein VFZ48_02095 [Candidatus Saccharimonadales bacterium]